MKTMDFFTSVQKYPHQHFYNPGTKKTAIVPFHPGRDLKKGTFLAILKQAGIEKDNWG